MKKQLSIFIMAARSSLHKVLLLFLASALVEIFLFRRAAANPSEDSQFLIEELIEQSWVDISFIIFSLILYLFLENAARQPKSHQIYTVKRLQVSDASIVFWWGLYNFICFMAYRVMHLILMIILMKDSMADVCYDAGDQTLFLAFCRNPYLHSLLPVLNIKAGLMIIAIEMAVSVAAAEGMIREKTSSFIFVVYVVHYSNFMEVSLPGKGLWLSDVMVLMSLLFIAVTFYRLFEGDRRVLNEDRS